MLDAQQNPSMFLQCPCGAMGTPLRPIPPFWNLSNAYALQCPGRPSVIDSHTGHMRPYRCLLFGTRVPKQARRVGVQDMTHKMGI
jgi:hypothetical protein